MGTLAADDNYAIMEEIDLEKGLVSPGRPRKCCRKEKCWEALIYVLIAFNVLGLIGLLVGFILWLTLQK